MRARHDVGAEAEPLHHARPEALDQRVGALDHAQRRRDRVGVLQVEADAAPAALHDVPVRRSGRRAHRAGAVDAQDLGAHVREHHRGERSRPDARELEDADAVSGPGAMARLRAAEPQHIAGG